MTRAGSRLFMKATFWLVVALLSSVLFWGASSSVAQENTERGIIDIGTPEVEGDAGVEDSLETRSFGDAEIVVGEVIVRYTAASAPAARADAREEVDVEARDPLLLPRTEVLSLESGQSVGSAIAALEADPAVRAAEPNYVMEPNATIPDDEFFDQLWGLDNTGQTLRNRDQTTGIPDADIDAPEAWDRGTGAKDVTVAVIDSGIDVDSPDLAPNLWTNPGESGDGKETNGIDDDGNGFVDDVNGWDFAEEDNDADDDNNGHGTHVAGTIGARGNDGFGVAGVNWETSLVPMRVGVDYTNSYSNSSIIDSYVYADRIGADVANGSYVRGGGVSQIELDALAAADETLFVFAAGNDAANNDTTSYHPCNYANDLENVVCVAATDQSDRLASFSNAGDENVDLGAPGVNIGSTYVLPTIQSFDALRGSSASQVPYTENFEAGLGGWEFTGEGNTWGRTDEAPLTSFGLSDSPGGDYANNLDISATSPPIDLTNRGNCVLIADFSTDLDATDNFSVEGSGDGGANWRQVGGSFRRDLPYGLYGLQLGSAMDNQPDARFRLRLRTDESGTADGVRFDNPSIECHPESEPAHVYLNGTSMAAPHVAGAAALLKSLAERAPASALEDRILATVDENAALASVTTTGGRLNVEHATRPPETTITSPDPENREANQTITFETDEENRENGTTFECRVDSEPFGACSGEGTDTRDYSEGEHTFEVRATWFGNEDPTPASVDFTVNEPPIAVGDEYEVRERGSLEIDAPGVLANDTDTREGNLTAVLDGGPANAASFKLNADGSFTYEPDAEFIGTDTFTYFANDGLDDSEEVATVEITVTELPDELKDCTIIGDDTAEIIEGTEGDDIICALGGNDAIDGLGGDDIIRGGEGIDALRGGVGEDRLIGAPGNDSLFGDEGADALRGGAGNDRAFGGAGGDALFGAPGNDRLAGQDGPDRLFGGFGADDLFGGVGNDTLDVRDGAGSDFANGGDDSDSCVGDRGDRSVFCERP